jgi:thioredoxin 1
MNTKSVILRLIIIILLGSIGYAVTRPDGDATGDMMTKDEKTTESTSTKEGGLEDMMKDKAMSEKGSYETYAPEKLAWADEGEVVLFFRASWCPTCRATDADIRAHLDAIPADLLILDVDYDNSASLKQKYGVTYQHTFVQVDAEGNQIAKWSGSPTLADIVSHVQ